MDVVCSKQRTHLQVVWWAAVVTHTMKVSSWAGVRAKSESLILERLIILVSP